MSAQNGINATTLQTLPTHQTLHDIDIKPEVSHENGDNGQTAETASEEAEPEPEVDITISNVVSNFSVKCHLNLRQIACNGSNVVYKREQSMILMKLREPRVTASIWSSGKITCTGATTEDAAKCAARRIARSLQKLGFKVKFTAFRIVNVLGTCILPFGIKIHEFSAEHRQHASYEPELHPGATYRMKDIKAVLKVFQTGAITITAPCVLNIQTAVERIYPLVYEYRKPKPPQSTRLLSKYVKKECKKSTNFIKEELIDSGSEFTDEEVVESLVDSDEEEDPDEYSDKSD